ncbi:hypothetical protein OQA88_7998 [Cercophora sp. LCS_1]
MSSLSLRALVQKAVLGFAILTQAVAIPVEVGSDAHKGLVPLKYTRADGNEDSIWVHPSFTYGVPVDKRSSWHTYTGNDGRNEYCGESNPTVSWPDDAPYAGNCQAIRDAITDHDKVAVKGYWTVSSAEFSAAGKGLVTLASAGDCIFAIRLAGDHAPADAYFGANDARFFTDAALKQEKNEKVEAKGTTSCNTGTEGSFLDTEYAITRAK